MSKYGNLYFDVDEIIDKLTYRRVIIIGLDETSIPQNLSTIDYVHSHKKISLRSDRIPLQWVKAKTNFHEFRRFVQGD